MAYRGYKRQVVATLGGQGLWCLGHRVLFFGLGCLGFVG